MIRILQAWFHIWIHTWQKKMEETMTFIISIMESPPSSMHWFVTTKISIWYVVTSRNMEKMQWKSNGCLRCPCMEERVLQTSFQLNWKPGQVELGAKRVELETGKNQVEAIGLYERSGYRRIPNYGQYTGLEARIYFERPR